MKGAWDPVTVPRRAEGVNAARQRAEHPLPLRLMPIRVFATATTGSAPHHGSRSVQSGSDAASAGPDPLPATGPMHTPPRWKLLLHAGAGSIDLAAMTSDEVRDRKTALRAALDAGAAVLADGGTALDAVCATVVWLEDCPLFNAGVGSVLDATGTCVMDASVMVADPGDVDTRRWPRSAGSVAGLRQARNPILAARHVMEHTPHVAFAGPDAEAWLINQGLATLPPDAFVTEARRAAWERARATGDIELDHDGQAPGTVGAVAIDMRCQLAAATSTGGMTNKMAGRVSDSACIGAGTWADAQGGAISCTGHGEFFLRHGIAARIAERRRTMPSLQRTAALLLDEMARAGGEGGLIAIGPTGEHTMPFTSAGMYRGVATSEGWREVGIGPGRP